MPAVTKAEHQETLNELKVVKNIVDALQENLSDMADDRRILEHEVSKHNETLERIVKAARGWSVAPTRGRDSVMAGGFDTYGSAVLQQQHGCEKPSDLERAESQIRELSERVVSLESRLAATIAVAEFAQR